MEITCDEWEFEHALGVLYERMGYSVEVTKATGDGGIDLNIFKRASFWSRRRRHYIVQAKHWESSVGEPEIRDLYGTLMHVGGDGAILVTSSYFSKKAIAFADGKPIELIDGDALAVLIKRFRLEDEFCRKPEFPSADPFSPLTNTGSVRVKRFGMLPLLAVVLACLVAFGGLYSLYHDAPKSSESAPTPTPIQPPAIPQKTSTPVPEKSATETLPQPQIIKAPKPAPIEILIEPTLSPEAQARALQKYPILGIADSAFNRVFVLRYNFYRKHKPEFFSDPEWPIQLADDVAKIAGGALLKPEPSVRPSKP
ncbi:MAG: restriction endonuclease [Verrucomicrobiota bacterium]